MIRAQGLKDLDPENTASYCGWAAVARPSPPSGSTNRVNQSGRTTIKSGRNHVRKYLCFGCTSDLEFRVMGPRVPPVYYTALAKLLFSKWRNLYRDPYCSGGTTTGTGIIVRLQEIPTYAQQWGFLSLPICVSIPELPQLAHTQQKGMNNS